MIETGHFNPDPTPANNPHRDEAQRERSRALARYQEAEDRQDRYVYNCGGLIDPQYLSDLFRKATLEKRALARLLDIQEGRRSHFIPDLADSRVWSQEVPIEAISVGGRQLKNPLSSFATVRFDTFDTTDQ